MLTSGSMLLSNTVIMLLMFMSLKAVSNNQPQEWFSGHKLLVFWEDSRYSLHNLFTKICIFLFSICNFLSLYTVHV